MKGQVSRQFDTLLRVSAFGEKHSDLFPPSSLSGNLFGIIADAIPELRENDGSQAAGFAVTREGVTAKSEAREALRECMLDISRTARAIGRDQAAVEAKFRWPGTVSDKALLAGARGFVESAAPLAAVFVAHEMEANFIEELKAAILRFEDAIKKCAEKKSFRVSATASIDSTMEKAMDAVYRLDGIVPNKIKKNYSVQREWEAARRSATARTARVPDAPPAPPKGTPPATAAA